MKKIEEERDAVSKEFEDEQKKLENLFEMKMISVLSKRRKKIEDNPQFYSEFWLRAMTNHSVLKEYITEEDRVPLKSLSDIRIEKLNNGINFKLIFEFKPNDYFSNVLIEKVYYVTGEMLIEKIESTKIDWKEGKCLTSKKVSKFLKNKKTAEKKNVEVNDTKNSFFNFFTELRMPSVEEINKIDFDLEKEIGQQLDLEYEYAMEFIEDLMPHALEYFMGIKHDTDEYVEYINEKVIENSEKPKDKKKKGKNKKKGAFFNFNI